MSCREVRSSLRAGQLPEGDGPLARHVAGCSGCQRAVEAARLERALFRGVEAGIAPPPGFAERVRRRLPQPGPGPAEAESAVWLLGRRVLPGLALLALLLGGVTLWLNPALTRVPPPGEALAEPPVGERLVVSDLPLSRDLVLASVLLREGGRE